jgi:probable F420-dependent oxidoreductase
MRIGVVFPQTEFGNDVGAIRAYAQAAEELGFSHLLAYDHVLGAAPTPENSRRNGWDGAWRGPYTDEHAFHEVFVLFSYLAALTTRLEFVTGILVLPQRQAAVVAKQAAELDVLSGGRLRIGVGVGWNKVEMEALGMHPENRGRRVDEQIEVLRALWTEPVVRFEGRYHHLPEVGIRPMPVQRPIPLWFGGHADEVVARVAKYGAGWMPGFREADQAREWLAKLDRALAAQGRRRSEIGIEPRILFGDGDPDKWRATLDGWRAAGAGHASVNTMGLGFIKPEQHIDAIRQFAEEIVPSV